MKRIFSSPTRFQALFVFAILITVLIGGAGSQKVLGSNLSEEYQCNGSLMTKEGLLAYRELSMETMQSLNAEKGLLFSELCDIPQIDLDQAIAALEKIDYSSAANEFRNLRLVEAGQHKDAHSGISVGGTLFLNVDDVVYSISGTVYEENNSPVSGAIVKASTGASTTTAGDGTYTLYPVPDGDIIVTVEASGYGPRSQTVSVSGNVTGVDFTLKLGFEDPASRWTVAFDYNHGWRVDSHPRMFADVNGDGYDDALGFGLDGIYVALSDGSNFATNATKWTSAFDYNHGWRVDSHPRMFADVNGDGNADALGFGLDGIYVALSDGSSFAANATKWTSAFDYNHGWRVDSHPRMFADVNDDGNADALGFGLDGIYVALSNGSSFAANATKWTSAFDYNHGWRVDSHPRMFADVNGDGYDDAVGFGLDGIYIALSDGSSFAANATKWTSAFDYNHGWRVDSHPRMFADVNGDGNADALGFGLDGVYVVLSDGSSLDASASRWTTAFDYNHGWRVDSHPRMFADVNGDGFADAGGFGLDGIYIALAE